MSKREWVMEGREAYEWYTHTHLTALCQALPGWAGTGKVKPIWILLKQETVSGSGISCQHPTAQFLQAGCPSCRPTNNVKALKAYERYVIYIYFRTDSTDSKHIHFYSLAFSLYHFFSFSFPAAD